MLTRICFMLLTAALAAEAVTYSYDSAGRLVKADYGGAGAIVYAYDNAGNLLNRSVQGGGAASTITSVNTADAGSGIGQNTWIEIKGVGIAPRNTPAGGVMWSDAPESASGRLPTRLKGVSVTVNGKAAYVYSYCSGSVKG